MKKIKLNPGFLKNQKNKITHVYLEINDYNALMNELKKFDKIKKAVKNKKK